MLRFVEPQESDSDCFAGFEFDPGKSHLLAYIKSDEPDVVLWTIHLEWLNNNNDEPAHKRIWAEIAELVFNEKSWRDLAGQEIQAPDDATNFYSFSTHEGTDENDIHIGARNGTMFDIDWHCDLVGEQLEIRESAAFKTLVVGFPDDKSVDLESAKSIASRYLGQGEYGQPTVRSNCVDFPISANLK